MPATKTKEVQAAKEPVVDSVQLTETEEKIRRDIIGEIEGMSPAQFRASYPGLYAKIASEIADETGAVKQKQVPGFLLEKDDPFALACERQFIKCGGVGKRIVVRKIETSRLPLILPYEDQATRTALESYILRAQGAGDSQRAAAARAALQECK